MTNYIKLFEDFNKHKDLEYIHNQLQKRLDFSPELINRGSCFEFAQMLHEYLNYNEFLFIEMFIGEDIIHVFIKLNDDLYFDALGFQTLDEIKFRYNVLEEEVDIDEIDEDDEYTQMFVGDIDVLDNCPEEEGLSTIELEEKDWQIIESIIKEAKLYYS